MRYEKIKEIFDLLFSSRNIGFEIYDISGKLICQFANHDGERDSRGLMVILEQEEMTVFFPRYAKALFSNPNKLELSPDDGLIQVMNYPLIGHILLNTWGWNVFQWEHLEMKGKDIYFINQEALKP